MHTVFDVGVTHVATLVDELVVVAGMLDAHTHCRSEYSLAPRSLLPAAAELALVTGLSHGLQLEVGIEEATPPAARTALDAVSSAAAFIEAAGRGDLKCAWGMMCEEGQAGYGQSVYADAARQAKEKEQRDARAAQARLVAMEARGGDALGAPARHPTVPAR